MTQLQPKDKQPAFIQQQYAFAAHIRDPEANPAPEKIEDRRMNIYRDLFYNNVEGFLSTNFPVLHEILSEDNWHRLIRAFYSTHLSLTPYFPEFPQEFIAYLQNEHELQPGEPEFMLELAHYEWVELALTLEDDIEADDTIIADADLLETRPIVSPLAWPLNYQYAVHQISPDFLPENPSDQPVYLLAYRAPDDEVCFMDLNPVTFRLLQLLSDDLSLTGRAALEKIASELDHPQPEVVIKGGNDIMNDLRKRSVILGGTKITP